MKDKVVHNLSFCYCQQIQGRDQTPKWVSIFHDFLVSFPCVWFCKSFQTGNKYTPLFVLKKAQLFPQTAGWF